jgi:hypothetical protein
MVNKAMKSSTVIIIAIAVAILAFVGGMFYGKASAPASTGSAFQNGGGFGRNSSTGSGQAGGRFAGGAGGGIAAGQILSRDSQSITLQLPNGNSEVVFYSPSTQITVTKTASGSVSDLAVGTTVIVSSSTSNSDGSITAQAIQVRTGGGGFLRGNQ